MDMFTYNQVEQMYNERLLYGLSFEELGKKYYCSRNTISRYFIKYGFSKINIDKHKLIIKKYGNSEFLDKLNELLDSKLSYYKIAKILNTNRTSLIRRVKVLKERGLIN